MQPKVRLSSIAADRQRTAEMWGLLCGTATKAGMVHILDRTAETVEKLTEASLRTEQAIHELTAQIQTVVMSSALQAERVTRLETERDAAKNKAFQFVIQGVGGFLIKFLMILVAAGAIVYGYVQSGFAKASH